MKVLHILRSEPDEIVERLTGIMSEKCEASVLALYEEKVNWKSLVDYVFTYDKVICWWWEMKASLLILVADEDHMHHVLSLTKAACERGKQVSVLFSGHGVKLVRHPGFRDLMSRATISICESSFRDFGLADDADGLPAALTTCLVTQAQHAEILAQTDRHIVL